jgi:hypothetical protein
MIYLLDPVTLQAELAGMGNEQRGLYILTETLNLIAGKETSWAKKEPKKRTVKELGGYSSEFEEFWRAYPKRVSKGGAYASWQKIVKHQDANVFVTRVLNALNWQTRQLDWTKEDGKYVPMPVTYLNNRRWEDDQPIKKQTGERYMDMNGQWQTR